MDFTNRNSQPQPSQSAPFNAALPQAPNNRPEHHSTAKNDKKRSNKRFMLWRVASICWLFALTILVAATIVMISFGSSNQNDFVKKDNYQAVFLTNGQVYFGHIDNINKDSVRLSNIFYLTQDQASDQSKANTSGDYTLVKLGCQQIHDPLDQMVINRDQVTFWENLSNSGKVTASIQEYNKQNPNGPNCTEQPSDNTQASSNANTQPAANPNNASSSSSKSSTSSKDNAPAKP